MASLEETAPSSNATTRDDSTLVHTNDVKPEDAERLVRSCDWPAFRQDEWKEMLFPRLSELSDEDSEECIVWTIARVHGALSAPRNRFRMITEPDGQPCGYIGWTIDDKPWEKIADRSQEKREDFPKVMDYQVYSHMADLRTKERTSLLVGHENVLRIFTLVVSPKHQRRGIGSMLMDYVCAEADRDGLEAFVMSSTIGMRVYGKSGFVPYGALSPARGEGQCMFREARPLRDLPHE